MENTEESKYEQLLADIVKEVKLSRIKFAKRLSKTVIEMYWSIGKTISEKTTIEGYGSQVVNRLSVDLKRTFPAYGFSPRNLWDMKRFYERYRMADEKLRQVVAELPWGHNLLLLNKTQSIDEAFYYAWTAAKNGWTRNILLNNLKADSYSAVIHLPKQHNFKEALPEHLHEQAEEILKSRYNLSFLGLSGAVRELELEQYLLKKIRHFILELGNGFSFIGNQYRLGLGDKEYFVDMLFFNRHIKSLVAVELKIGAFEPEYIGKLNFYLNLLDKELKMPDENPSIGILLCADKDSVEVEIALQNVKSPIGVADYQLEIPKDKIKAIVENEIKQITQKQ